MEYNEIIGLSVIAIVAFFLSCFKKGLLDMLSKKISSWFKEKFEGEEINKEFSAIYERLVEIKTKINADRVFIDQFHNGSVFTNNKPMWKITRTYEICANGVSYESKQVQNTMAVTIWDSISAIFDTKIKKYCEKLRGTVCESGCKNQYGVYKYDVGRMPESFAKVLLRNQGVESYFQIPIIYEKSGIVGFVGIHFLDENDGVVDPCFLCQKVQEISYFLNKD